MQYPERNTSTMQFYKNADLELMVKKHQTNAEWKHCISSKREIVLFKNDNVIKVKERLWKCSILKEDKEI